MKFIGYCEDCGKQYTDCKCAVYMSAHRHGRTRPSIKVAPTRNKRGQYKPASGEGHLSARQQERYDRLNMQHWEEPPRIR